MEEAVHLAASSGFLKLLRLFVSESLKADERTKLFCER